MAERRMFAKTIIDSDAFLDMPVTARLLYYDLAMRADDDGFVNAPKKIMRIIGASQDDLSILMMRKFIIAFDNGIVVIKHWRIHNYIRQDTYNETKYKEQKSLLELDENKAYRLIEKFDNEPSTVRLLSVDDPSTQDRLGKDSIGKDSIGKDSNTISYDMVCCTDVQRIIDAWNGLGLGQVRKIVQGTQREQLLKKRIRDYGVDEVLRAIENVRNSAFLNGNNSKGWIITFDWFIKPNNFPKVLDGNYKSSNGSKLDETYSMIERWANS